jgi:PAS domain S-box-containing protein
VTRQERRTEVLMRRPSRMRFVLLALLAPALLAALLVWLNQEYARSEALRAEAAASFDRRITLIQLLSSLKDAETAQRGFLLTGGVTAFLQPYEPARRAVAANLAAARRWRLPADEALLMRRIDTLVARKFAEMDRTIAAERSLGGQAAQAQVLRGNGKAIMDTLRRLVGAKIALEEQRSLSARRRFGERRAATQAAATGGGLLAILIVTILLVVGWRLRRERYDATIEAFEAAERNRTVLDSTVDAILILNPSGTIEAVNAAAISVIGYAPEELQRRDIATVIDLAPGEGSFHERIGLRDGQLDRSFLPNREVRRKDGSVLPVDVAMGVMLVPSGDHIVVSLRDISERRRLEQLKDDLMSTVSHELRTPLTSIVGSLGLLRAGSAGALPEAAARLVTIAENNSRRLIRLINDMLDIDRIETGTLEMQMEPIDLQSVVDHAVQGTEGLASAKGVTLALAKSDGPVIVRGDADRLLQVLTNLLSNAVRFTPAKGQVAVAVRCAENGSALVTVDDDGPGIPPEFRSRIFDRFERAQGEAGQQGGAGLGLAISREIIQRHNGRIWFEDAPGGGARFAFALDCMCPATMSEPGAARVLICEQDREVAGRLIAMAVKEGCAYDLARSGVEARAALARTSFDALLVDLNLPEDGGLAFVRAARLGPPPLHAPIIVIATERRGDGSATPLDVIDWIDKPGDVDRLTGALRRALSRSGRDRPTILHLDDDKDLLQVVATALEPEARIVTATDLTMARAILETTSPDAAILDLRLADGSGLDLIPFLVDANGLAIPTIIYSAQDVASDLANQVDAVLVKARGSLPDLKATLRRVIRARDEGDA